MSSEEKDNPLLWYEFVEEGKYDQAQAWLEINKDLLPADEYFSKKGLIYFLSTNYDEAVIMYDQALSIRHQAEWAEVRLKAIENAKAKLQVFVPEIEYFQREHSLNTYKETTFTNSTGQPLKKNISGAQRIKNFVGNVFGDILSFFVQGLTMTFGKLAGYRDQVWTNWYRRPQFLGILTLAYMREWLNAHALYSTYPPEEKVGFVNDRITVPPGVQKFRTANGTWNNLDNPMEGAAGTRFMRNISPQAPISVPEELLVPNPRTLSRELLTRTGPMKEVPFLNMLAAAWIQFQNHDWISHGEVVFTDVYAIPLAEDDPVRKKYWQTKMFVAKTQPDPTRSGHERYQKTYLNEVTHWWDGSQIYGSDQATQNKVRAFKYGKLRLTDGRLPLDKDGMEITGYVRNWWVGLSMFHHLFSLEHNAICDHLITHNPDWNDEQLFHTARLINAALMAKIHSVEWNSAINPNPVIKKGNLSNWYGLLTVALRSPDQWQTVEDINLRNTELGGVVGNPIKKHGVPYGLTQEFVEVYRLHSMLPETLHLKKLDTNESREIPFVQSRQMGSAALIDEQGLDNLFYSFGVQHPGQLVLNNFPRFMQELSIPGNPIYDLGAVDILRARERGVPRYNEFRRQMGLKPVNTFAELNSDKCIQEKLIHLYHGDIEKLDLMIGTLAEEKRPTHFAFGETMFQIFLLNATRRLQADRFYTDCYKSEYYTSEGMTWIDRNNLKSVLLRHFPDLKYTGLVQVENAFEPWKLNLR